MKTAINFLKTALRHCIVKPVKWYIKISAKNYESLYGQGWENLCIPVWL